MNTTITNVIEIENLNKYFGEGENRAHILKDVNVKIQQGDFVAIIGASGSGKSTLMNIIGCLDTASSGVCRIAGKETQQCLKCEWKRGSARHLCRNG